MPWPRTADAVGGRRRAITSPGAVRALVSRVHVVGAPVLVVVLVLALGVAACGPAAPATVDPVNPPVLRYVALGDSYTIGTSVAAEERWPDQLVGRLAAAPPPAATLELVSNHAVNGYTSADVIARELPQLGGDGEIGFVSLLIGVNDVVQGVPEATYQANVETILAALLDRVPANRIVCVETPDYTVTPQGAAFGDPATQRAGIARNNEILLERCEAAGIKSVGGIFAISGDAAADPTLVASDGLHPSGAQYRRWVVERIEPAVRALLALP
jgi:lysophospholipase L1-like esterase